MASMNRRSAPIAPRTSSAAVAAAIALTSATWLSACSPDPAATATAPTAPVQVDPSHYETYRNYSGYRRTYITETQFATSTGIRCRIGPNTGDYDAGIRCWGPLPGVAPSINQAVAKAFAHDTDTHELITTKPPDPRRSTHAFLDTADLAAYETYLDSGLRHQPVAPTQYHLLAPGQMIEVPGTGGDTTVSVCAAGTDDSLACQIRPTDDGAAHGFELSTRGSRAY